MLFGLNISTSARSDSNPVAAAQHAEALGFDFVSASDHLHGGSPTFETWTMLAWIAACTSRIHVATRVLAVPYRSPAVLAKMAESFDRLSGGRLILGLGGGAMDDEFRAFGLPTPSARDKIDGLEEAIRIIRGMWSEQQFSLAGRLHRTECAQIEPKAERRIPIWLGTFGDRALAVTGRLADGWIPSLGYAPPEQVVVMRDKLLAAARAAGRDPSEITCAYNVALRIDDRETPPEPNMVSGSANAVADQLIGFVRLGFTALNFILVGDDTHEQAERLTRDVIPTVRAAAQ